MGEVESVAEAPVEGTRKVEETTVELVEVRAERPPSLSLGTFQSRMTFCFSRTGVGVG